ncbi:leucine-rich repeat protein [Flammeovirga sp. SubArs3]|uniref:leucine-rich repeat protein n=1 Tax=Flammeovirga sp. SubArs3 TaxID=2995316 RepID=UPI00248CD3C7|nr:leucine-rich repeat protein [Flammeovirga sp. SubArs3]
MYRLPLLLLIFLSTFTSITQAQHVLEDDDVIVENGILLKSSYVYGDIIIPRILDNQEIIEIGEKAFLRKIDEETFLFNRSEFIRSVVIPPTVKVIGKQAFEKHRIHSVIIPESVEIIGDGAFARNYLTAVQLPEGLDSLGEGVFYDNQLKEITIPSSVTKIGDECFRRNELENVAFNGQLNRVPKGLFRENQLTEMVLKEVYNDSIPEYSFRSNFLTEVDFEGISYIGENAFSYNSFSSLQIPADVELYKNPFEDNRSLEEVVFLEGWKVLPDAYFKGFESIKKVVIPEGVTKIGDNIFEGNVIEEVNLPSTLEVIGERAFYENQLKSITLPASLDSVKSNAFWKNQIVELNIETNHIYFGDRSFYGNQIAALALKDKEVELGEAAFAENEIKVLTIGDKINYISESCFENNKIQALDLSDFTGTLGEEAFYRNEISVLHLPSTLVEISEECFASNRLTEITFPENIEVIGERSFASNLLSENTLNFNEKVREIKSSAFSNNEFLSFILPHSATEGKLWYTSSYAFPPGMRTPSLTVTYSYRESVEERPPIDTSVPYTLTDADVEIVNGRLVTVYPDLTDVQLIIPEILQDQEVKILGENVLRNKHLVSIELPNTVTILEKWSLQYNNFTSVILPESLEEIHEGVFGSSLYEGFHLPSPSALKRIDKNIFMYNSQLKSLPMPEPLDGTSIWLEVETGKIYEPLEEITYSANYNRSYILIDGAKDYTLTLDDVVIDDNGVLSKLNRKDFMYYDRVFLPAQFGGIKVTKIGEEFFNNVSAKYIEISSEYDTIYERSFRYSKIDQIKLPETLKVIEREAFMNSSFTFITLPSTLVEIQYGAFSGAKLEAVVIPEGMTEIAPNTFQNNKSLSTVVLPSGVKKIGNYAFYGCNLEEVDLSNVTDFGDFAFALNHLSTVIFNDQVVSLGTGVFKNNNFTELVFPEGINRIPTEFLRGNKIEKLTLPLSIQEVGNYAFQGNSINEILYKNNDILLGDGVFMDNELEVLYLPTNLKKISSELFQGNKISGTITIPSFVKNIGDFAFKDNEIAFIDFNEGLLSIGEKAFYGNAYDTIELPNSLVHIKSKAFNELSYSTSHPWVPFHLPEHPTYEGYWKAGSYTYTKGEYQAKPYLEYTFIVEDTITLDENHMMIENNVIVEYFSNKSIQHIIIPDELNGQPVEGIGDYVFSSLGIKSLKLGENIKSIGKGAFRGNDIEELYFPNTVREIGYEAFSNNNLWKVKFEEEDSQLIRLQDNVFDYNNIIDINLPEGLKFLEDGVFYHNDNFPVIELPTTLLYIGEYTFSTMLYLPYPSLSSVYGQSTKWISYKTYKSNVLDELISESGDNIPYGNLMSYRDNKIPELQVNLNFPEGEVYYYEVSGDVNLVSKLRDSQSTTFMVNKGNSFTITPKTKGYEVIPSEINIEDIQESKSFDFTVGGLKKYQIKYHVEEGIDTDKFPSEFTINTPTFNLPEISKAHYIFEGWYTDKEFTEKVENIEQGSYDDIDLYPLLTPVVYPLTYHHMEGVIHENPKTVTIADLGLVLTPATKADFTFIKWSSNPDFTDEVVAVTEENLGHLDLYAEFSVDEYAIYYSDQEIYEVNNPSKFTVYDFNTPLNDAVKMGYDFSGWYLEEQLENKITAIPSVGGDITLYPEFTIAEYHIIYHDEYRNEDNPRSYNIASDSIIFVEAKRNNYDFKGWYKDATFLEEQHSIPAGSYGDIELYAKWEYNLVTNIDHLLEDELVVYPNPVCDQFKVTTTHQQLTIYSLEGKLIKSFKVPQSAYNITDLTQGIYLIEIVLEDHTVVRQRIIKR